ncbi:MAG: hypothetical protein H0W43_07710 [Chthoniobacterales bacterium]|nr:hypothetical protein [Chthoniobacterales bacterium]
MPARYRAKPCDGCSVPLEDCPTCGYALSIADHRCRHCAPGSFSDSRLSLIDSKNLIWLALVLLGAVGYLFFFR